jgi:hypothetical protein
MTMITRLCVLLLMVFVTSGVVAQPRNRTGPDPQPPVAQDRREAIKKRIRVLRAATLTDELNLDEKALSRVLPVLAKYDDVTEDLLKKRLDIHGRLTAADPVKDPRGVDRIVDEAIANQKAFWQLEEQRLAELRKILTPGQIARLLIVLPEFERRIQNQLRRAMVRGAAGAAGQRGARGGNRGLDLDDDDDDPTPTRRQDRR